MNNDKFSALDMLDLPELERAIYLHLMRNDGVVRGDLSSALDRDPSEIDAALANLLTKKRVAQTDDGRFEAVSGRVTRRTSLPPQFWSPFVPSTRSFSDKDIQALRIAIPMLQFARAKLAQFVDHGPTHVLRVRGFAEQLGHLVKLTSTEQFYLRTAVLFHDVGNIVDRSEHHIISQQTVERLSATGELPLTPEEAQVVGLVCRWHRRDYDPQRVDLLSGETIRTGLLASVIRVADAMDIDLRRSDYTGKMRQVLEFFFPGERPYFTSLEDIYGVRICCTPDVRLQVFTRGQLADNMQIAMLRRDLASTPLTWTIEEIPVYAISHRVNESAKRLSSPSNVLLAFPFEPHSLVMAALSRKHLRAADYNVQSLCYADTLESAQSLWREELGEQLALDIAHVVVVGGRLAESDLSLAAAALSRMSGRGTRVTLLNRRVQAWDRNIWLLQPGVELILGGDWAYFWGETADEADMRWARVAALCGRDPGLATFRFSDEEKTLADGLLTLVHDRLNGNRYEGMANWTSQAEALLTPIETDDRAFFQHHAYPYHESVKLTTIPRVEGRVIVLVQPGEGLPNELYWALEAAIEQRGLALEQGIQFRSPYAIALWGSGDMVDLLAIRHWREEAALPIRLLFPDDGALSLQGNENVVYVTVPSARVPDLLQAVITACNR